MKETTKIILEDLMKKYPSLLSCEKNIAAAFTRLTEMYKSGNKLLLCGNGGSAADCEHIVGELMKSFKKKRPVPTEEKTALCQTAEGRALAETLEGGLKAISLTSHLSLSTAFANDKQPLAVFAQQLYVLGDRGDALLCISTSGNSQNCVYAATVARLKGMFVISLTGEKESALSACSDICVRVPETETYKVQELHLPVYHALCAMLEEEIF